MNTKNQGLIENYKHLSAIINIAATTTIYKNTVIYAYNTDNFIASLQKVNTN